MIIFNTEYFSVSFSSLICSDINIPRNVSCPVSPIGSPLLHSRSPQHLNGRMSPSPISSPRTTSGSSTPLTCGSGSVPFGYMKQSTYLQEGFGSMPKPSSGLYVNGSSYYDKNPDIFRVLQSGSHTYSDRSLSLLSSTLGAFWIHFILFFFILIGFE